MPSVYPSRRPRPSPLWQLVHHGWEEFPAQHETKHRKNGTLHPAAMQKAFHFAKKPTLVAILIELPLSPLSVENGQICTAHN